MDNTSKISDSITGGLKGFIDNMWTSVPFHAWPYWNLVLYGLGGLVVLVCILWLYNNFWKSTSGEVVKEAKI